MLSKYHIRLLIEACREMSWDGLDNGVKAPIPELEIDILEPPNDFLGVQGNPAIFVNEKTYNLLGSLHPDWVLNKTIAIKGSLLLQQPIELIGTILHEIGHAFNVAAQRENTEGNAYIFEIEMLRKLLEEQSSLLFGCTQENLKTYFAKRLSFYRKATQTNPYLATLVEEITQEYQLEGNMQKPTVRAWMIFFIRKREADLKLSKENTLQQY